ncbi:MAG TPA: type II toxin-antitoxin system Phd/YefM family antitoxin [Actinocrinis sp.]|jgi:prevent-host-death family protein
MTSMSVTEARAQFGQLLHRAQYGGETIEITQHGRPAAAVISAERLARLEQIEQERELAEAQRVMHSGGPLYDHADVAATHGLTPDGRPLPHAAR